MTTYWHYTVKGIEQPAVDEQALIGLIRNSTLGRYELVWKHGMSKWKPAGALFDDYFALYQEPKPRFLWLTLFWAACLAATITLSLAYKAPVPGGVKLVLIWTFLGMVFSTPSLLRRLYILAKRLGLKKNKKLGFGLKLGTLALTVMFAIMYSTQMTLLDLRLKTNTAMNNMKNYKMVLSPNAENPSVLVINGTIGPGFAKALKEQLDAHPTLKIISITSSGGLLGETLDAAQVIEEHPKIAVYAKKECASGCIVLLFAANERWADADMKLGFHGAGSVVGPNHSAEVKKHNIHIRLADAYLEKRNVPADVLAHKYSSGDTSFYYVETPRLLAAGSLTALRNAQGQLTRSADGNAQRAAPSRGTAPATAQAAPSLPTRTVKPGEADPVAEKTSVRIMLDAMAKADPQFMKKALAEIQPYVNDPEMRTAAMRYLIIHFLPKAYETASGPALDTYFKNMGDQLRYLAKQREWQTCFIYKGHQDRYKRSEIDASLLPAHYSAVAGLLMSSSAANKAPPSQQITLAIDQMFRKVKEYDIQYMNSVAFSNDTAMETVCMKALHIVDEVLKEKDDATRFAMQKWFLMRDLR